MDRKDCANQVHRRPSQTGHASAVVALLAWLGCAAVCAADAVTVWPTATISEDHIRLGDIAVVSGFAEHARDELQELVLCPAPPAGGSRVISLREVRTRLQENQINMARVSVRGASACVVQRPAQLAPAADPQATLPAQAPDFEPGTLAECIRAHIRAQLEGFRGRLQLDFGRSARGLLELSEPQHRFRLEPQRRRRAGPWEFKVVIDDGRNAPREVHVTVMVNLFSDVVVAARYINRGQDIQARDVRLERRSFQDPDLIGADSLSQVVGQQARRAISVGSMIQQTHVRSVPLVSRNDLVLVTASSQGIELTFSARAMDHGCLGEVVKLRNESSRQIFWGRVIGLRQAEALAGPEKQLSQAGGFQ